MESVSVKVEPAKRVLSVDIDLNIVNIVSMHDVKLKYEQHLDCYRVTRPDWVHDASDVVRFEKKHISNIRKHYNEELNVLFTTINIKIDGKIEKEDA